MDEVIAVLLQMCWTQMAAITITALVIACVLFYLMVKRAK